MTPYQISLLHSYARRLHSRYADQGAVFDKRLTRFNDIVAVGIHYAKCGPVTSETLQIAMAGVLDAVLACIKVWVLEKGPTMEPMYVAGRGPATMISPWMEC